MKYKGVKEDVNDLSKKNEDAFEKNYSLFISKIVQYWARLPADQNKTKSHEFYSSEF